MDSLASQDHRTKMQNKKHTDVKQDDEVINIHLKRIILLCKNVAVQKKPAVLIFRVYNVNT